MVTLYDTTNFNFFQEFREVFLAILAKISGIYFGLCLIFDEICAKMNGGGHKGAAGASFACSYEEGKAQLLSVIKAALDGLNQ